MRVTLAVALTALLLSGCEDKPPAGTVVDPQIETLEKARAVDGQVREAAERRKAEAEPEQIPSGY